MASRGVCPARKTLRTRPDYEASLRAVDLRSDISESTDSEAEFERGPSSSCATCQNLHARRAERLAVAEVDNVARLVRSAASRARASHWDAGSLRQARWDAKMLH